MWMQTYSGTKFYIKKNTITDINIEDIAHALSNLCRYGGHTKEFYSVAEHSYWCASYCRRLYPHLVLDALMHDATEAYLVDIPRPIKQYLREYKELEVDLQKRISRKFSLYNPTPEEVKRIDNRILMSESNYVLLGGRNEGWTISEDMVEFDDFRPMFWEPRMSKQKFLGLFYDLT